MHKLKTELFMEMIESGAMPLRPGVSRLISESALPARRLALMMLKPDRLTALDGNGTDDLTEHHVTIMCHIPVADEAIDNGVKVAVCSTSNEKAVSTIVRVMLGPKVSQAEPTRSKPGLL